MPSDRKPPELRAPEQNPFLGAAARGVAGIEDAVEKYFELPLDLFLPVSSEFLEKASYGDPLFRMPTQSNIPITADREYLMEALLGPAMYGVPAAKGLGRAAKSMGKPARPRFTEEELSYLLNELEAQRFSKGGGVKRGVDFLAEVLQGGSKPTDTKRRAALGLPKDLTPKPGEVVVKEEVKTAPKKGETSVSMTEAMNIPMSRRDVLRAGAGQAMSAMAPQGAMGALMKAAASPTELMKQAVTAPAKKEVSRIPTIQGAIARALKEGVEWDEDIVEQLMELFPSKIPDEIDEDELLDFIIPAIRDPGSSVEFGSQIAAEGPLEYLNRSLGYPAKDELRPVLREIKEVDPLLYNRLMESARDTDMTVAEMTPRESFDRRLEVAQAMAEKGGYPFDMHKFMQRYGYPED
jgi:hypothetical protein